MKLLLTFALLASYSAGQSLSNGGVINETRGFPVPNASSGGTVLYSTGIINNSGQAVRAAAAQTGPVFIVVGGAGTTGSATFASAGTLAPCTMDTSVASQGGSWWVVASTTTAGDCHPQASPPNPGTWVIGLLRDATTTSGSTAIVAVSGFIEGPVAGPGGGGGGGGAPIIRGSQALTCLAQSDMTSTGNTLSFPSLSIHANDTVIVALMSYSNTNTFSISDGTSNAYTVAATNNQGNIAQGFIFTSPLSGAVAASSMTITRTGTQKFVACVATYTGVSAIGQIGLGGAASGTGFAQSVSFNAGDTGHFMFAAFGSGGPGSTSYSQATGTLLNTGGTATSAGSTVTAAICENVAAAAGTLTCALNIANQYAWTGVAIELVPGGGAPLISSPHLCSITSDVSFSTTAGSICGSAFPAAAKAWIVHCAIPWNFTSGSGNANVTISINQSALAGTLPLTAPMVWTGVLWGTAGPVFGDEFQTNTGATTIITTTSLSLTDGRIYTAFIDGIANVPVAGGVFSVSIVSSAGVGSIRAGAYCTLQ